MSWRWKKVVGCGVGVAAFAVGSYHLAPSLPYSFSRTAFMKDLGGVGPPPPPSSTWRISSAEVSSKRLVPGQQQDASTSIISLVDECDRRRGQVEAAIEKARQKCLLVKEVNCLPGISVAVSVNGEVVWKEGFGYSDVENGVKMTPESVIRIASISKSMTMAMMGKLIEEGKVDVDAPIQKYIPTYPTKTFEGQAVTITVRHLLSHLSGIRHYKTKAEVDKEAALKEQNKNNKTTNNASLNGDAEFPEFFNRNGCDTLDKAMEVFKNDELFHKPGTKYYYSTNAWTVVSAIIEKVTETPFPQHCRKMFDLWGLSNTYLDEHEPIIFNRARHYCRDKNGRIKNCPWVDNSCKWAGGGFLSNVLDLTRFAHIMMYSHQANGLDGPVKGYLTRDTMNKLWTGNITTATPTHDNLYGLGFVVGEPFQKCLACKERTNKHVSHSGGAVGACSFLLMSFPQAETVDQTIKADGNQSPRPLNGVVVAVIINFINAPVTTLGRDIADIFQKYCL